MNIQIFGSSKCFDTKKAERWFKERKIPYQLIDLPKKGMSPGELKAVSAAVGGIDELINWDAKSPAVELMRYLLPDAKTEKLLENPKLFKTPVVRNGRQATLGYQPEVWAGWK